MTLYPVFFDLRGQRAVVVGAGEVALRKTRGLLAADALVTVIAPEVHRDFESLDVNILARGYQQGDLQGARLIFACTSQPDVNDEVAAHARALGVFCNHASSPERGDLRLGAVLIQGPLQVAVNSGAELPHLAQALRDKLSHCLPTDLPIPAWSARREAALTLPEPQRALVLSTLKAEIRKAVGL
ncbi:precorrin-2 dehydrogenase/sirohydrochlorin ferrochelatase family protein [Deinococcus peraridilitoris]|uniref:precorrin-2 dehydrogenase n=1 Tax=Deinococcus peraridilitoris (strain DSM 19664 / LMG 22246 / CIP 109416 / KR-200) TaxID=937777 RepID=L0A1Z6_DEIPD|nr:bifunctional precorrin-2 dehydrogenase/sirohydrochlorin ferrochelatase [Deinococcus peraridilitoris]AFZ67923.1 siroheme synthase, N-terminal domain protein [Deinococcus peraridilitoris DSM 19664]